MIPLEGSLSRLARPSRERSRTSMAVAGARELDPVSADVFRIRLLPSVLSLLAAVRDSALTFSYAATVEGEVQADLLVEGADRTTAED